jgi:hypothetical protein
LLRMSAIREKATQAKGDYPKEIPHNSLRRK